MCYANKFEDDMYLIMLKYFAASLSFSIGKKEEAEKYAKKNSIEKVEMDIEMSLPNVEVETYYFCAGATSQFIADLSKNGNETLKSEITDVKKRFMLFINRAWKNNKTEGIVLA